ncbi:putative n-terminal domain protein [Neofusicoccum parvum UCRNP2]|uniref:Putative n-terminal domain protein n=1 Tax=Botryosphaeria parva (strain UCR-NP2) TaxID=1287680 RepID=R1GAA8_BOTPV|nr:putative n-terminal domain protein [Neofusicoccum parvum UCRNP2]
MADRQEVEFTTLDGLTLRGWLYPAKGGRGPGIIMTPGFNIPKDMMLPEVAEAFQQAGITALLYDPRSIGASDGTPRNEIDPCKQVEDYSDALTFLARQPAVDGSCCGFWGMSFGGTVAGCAAALDKRARFVVMVCPLVRLYEPDKMARLLAKAMKDREAQAKGNAPFTLPLLTKAGDNPAGMNAGGGAEARELLDGLAARSPGYENRTTLQSYYRLALWQPHGLMPLIAPTPVLVVVPENDQVSPFAAQAALFDSLQGPKRKHVAGARGHFNVLSGGPDVQAVQERFVRDALAGRLDGELGDGGVGVDGEHGGA